jgi:predicted unusual protein kinase regulating ubiquinone biosynthesis (AarF/ABC1/UbiB family)
VIFKLKKNKSLHLAHAESGYLCCFKTNLNPVTVTEANNIVPFARKATQSAVEETVEQTAIQTGAKAGAGRVAGAVAGKVFGPIAGLADFFINAESTVIDPFGATAENTFNFANNPAETLTMALNSTGKLRLKLNGTVPLPEQYSLVNLARDVNIGFDGETYTLYYRGETIKLALGDGIEKKGDVLEIKTGGKTIVIPLSVGYKKPDDSKTKLANGGETVTPSLEEQQQKTEQQKATDNLNKANTRTRASLGNVKSIEINFLNDRNATPEENSKSQIFSKQLLSTILDSSLVQTNIESVKKALGAGTRLPDITTAKKESPTILRRILSKISNSGELQHFLNQLPKELVPAALNLAEKQTPKAIRTITSSEFIDGDNNIRTKLILESLGITSGKISQILSSDDSLPLRIRDILGALRSKGTPTRNITQAQEFIDKIYGKNEYTIVGNKAIGVGTVGEVFLAKDKNGKEVVIKMLKEGISTEQLSLEKAVWDAVVRTVFRNNDEQKSNLKMVEDLFKGIAEELDFSKEAQGAIGLANSGSRYKVASPIKLGFEKLDPLQSNLTKPSRAVSIVYEKANGLMADKLVDLIKEFQSDPQLYTKNNAKLIQDNPWLSNPIEGMKELPSKYFQAFSEQSFVVKNTINTIHGDPHLGNFFFDGQDIYFIDTGLVIPRKTEDLIDQGNFILELISHNSKALATRVITHAERLPDGKTKEVLIEELAEELKTHLFNQSFNLDDPTPLIKQMNEIVKKMKIIPDADNSIFYKAQGQAFTTYKMLSVSLGQSPKAINILLPDVLTGMLYAFRKHPNLAIDSTRDFFEYISKNPYGLVDSIESILKIEKGTLLGNIKDIFDSPTITLSNTQPPAQKQKD